MRIIIENRDGRGGDIAITVYTTGMPNNYVSLKVKIKEEEASCTMTPDETEELGNVLIMMARQVKER